MAQLKITVKDVYLTNLAIEDGLASQDGFVVNCTVNNHVAQRAKYPYEQSQRFKPT